jgi:hypothetical protein
MRAESLVRTYGGGEVAHHWPPLQEERTPLTGVRLGAPPDQPRWH